MRDLRSGQYGSRAGNSGIPALKDFLRLSPFSPAVRHQSAPKARYWKRPAFAGPFIGLVPESDRLYQHRYGFLLLVKHSTRIMPSINRPIDQLYQKQKSKTTLQNKEIFYLFISCKWQIPDRRCNCAHTLYFALFYNI